MQLQLLLLYLLVASPVTQKDVAHSRAMDGDWAMTSWINDGIKLDLTGQDLPNRLLVVNGKASLYIDEVLHTEGIKYAITRNTKHTTFSVSYSGSDETMAEYFRSKAFHGIFKIHEGKLYRCYVVGDQPLPDEFDSQVGSNRQLQVFVKRKQK